MIINKIKNLSIVKKMLLIIISGSIFVISYLSIGYFVAYKNRLQIEVIEKNILPFHSLSMENLKLFENLKVILNRFTFLKDKTLLDEANTIYQKILLNLKKLEKYGVDKQKLNLIKNYLIEYYSNIKSGNYTFNNSQKIFLLIEEFKDISYKDLTLTLKEINTNLYNTVITGVLIAIVLMSFIIIFSLYVVKLTSQNIDNVILSLKNLTKNKIDFSKRIPKITNDEMGELVDNFNIFTDKLEKDYNKLKNAYSMVEKSLIQQSKMAGMGEMISAISHQWKQPLNVISVIAQNLILDYELEKLNEKQILQFEEDINKQLKFMSKTMDEFRNFFKPSSIENEKFNLIDIIYDTYEILKPSLDEYSIKVNIKGEKLYVNGSSNEFMQVILNIVNNAKDVFIEKKLEGKIDIEIYSKDSKAIIKIKDNGGGIKDEFIDKIFTQYFSTKGDKGTGIGLYISKVIIKEHMKGDISVKNITNGAEFEIELNSIHN